MVSKSSPECVFPSQVCSGWQTLALHWPLASSCSNLTLDTSDKRWQEQTPISLADARLALYLVTHPSGTFTDVTCPLLMGFPHLHQPDPLIPTPLCPDSTRVEVFSYFPFREKLDAHCGDLIPLGIPLPPPPPRHCRFHLCGLRGLWLWRDLLHSWHQGSSSNLSHFLI